MLFDTLSTLDRLGRDLFSDGEGAIAAPVDLRRDGDRYVIEADLPGIDPEAVEVTVEGQWLTIRAERSSASTTEEAEWVVRERSTATFVRRFTLGDDIDPDGIEAGYHDGVLTVVVPAVEGSRRHKIPVSVGSGKHKALAGSTTSETEIADEGKAQAAHSQAS